MAEICVDVNDEQLAKFRLHVQEFGSYTPEKMVVTLMQHFTEAMSKWDAAQSEFVTIRVIPKETRRQRILREKKGTD